MNNLRSFAILVALANLILGGCSNPVRRTVESLSGSTMGTSYSIKYIPGADSPGIAEIGRSVESELASVNRQLSTYQDDSEIHQFNLNASTDWIAVSPETARVVQLALDFHKLSQGAFDVSVGPLVNLWGFGPDPQPQSIPSQSQIKSLLEHVGSEKLSVRLEPPALRKQQAAMQIDLSAIAIGHAVDRIAQSLESRGISNYLIDIGGEIRARGKRSDGKDWQVAIERPDVAKLSLNEIVGLSDVSLSTSRAARKAIHLEGQRFSSVIDPNTGMPVESDLLAVSVIMPNCASADAAATALMAMGFERAIQLTEQQRWATLLVARRNGELQAISSAEFERLARRVER